MLPCGHTVSSHHLHGAVLFASLHFCYALELHVIWVFAALSVSGRGLFASNLVCVKRVSLHQVDVDKKMRQLVCGPSASQFSIELVAPVARSRCHLCHGGQGSRSICWKRSQSPKAARSPQAESAALPRTLPRLNSFDGLHCATHELPSKPRVVSRRLAALLYKCEWSAEDRPCTERKEPHSSFLLSGIRSLLVVMAPGSNVFLLDMATAHDGGTRGTLRGEKGGPSGLRFLQHHGEPQLLASLPFARSTEVTF